MSRLYNRIDFGHQNHANPFEKEEVTEKINIDTSINGNRNDVNANDLTIEGIEEGIKKTVEQDTSHKPKYLSCVIDLSVDIPEPIPVLKQEQIVIFTRGNISAIGGKAKSRKTFLVALLASDYLKNFDNKMLIVDTEMAPAYTCNTVKRIHRLMNWETNQNNERLTFLNLREYTNKERISIIQEAIEYIRPELIFIDGIRDLVEDFNKIDESYNVVNILMRLSTQYDCHICSVLHENRINEQLRGHLGSEIINKSESVLSVTLNGETSIVKPEYTRNIPFEEFAFCINDDILPEYCDLPVNSAKDDKIKDLFETILSNGTTLSFTNLSNKVMTALNKSRPTADRKITQAVNMKIITKKNNGSYCLSSAKS